MKLRSLLLNVHLYLGLATGLVLAVVCLTGAILAFEKEIEQAMHPERYQVEAQGIRLPLDRVAARVEEALPGARVTGVTVHADSRRSLELTLSGKGSTRAYADPYTGALLDHHRADAGFFHAVEALHRRLLANDTGKMVVGVSTLLFLVILASGVVLWWPRDRGQLRARTRVKRGAGWKRLNHDLHVSLGIYAAVFLFVMGFTGLAWSFRWFNDGIYAVTSSPKPDPKRDRPKSVFRPGAERVPLETAYTAGLVAMRGAPSHTVAFPDDSAGSVQVRALAANAPHDRATDALYLDQYTGAVLKVDRWEGRSLGARARATFYPVHVGSIGGMPTRVLAFFACLLGATFPLSGMLIWWNKRGGRWLGRRRPRPGGERARRRVPRALARRETVG